MHTSAQGGTQEENQSGCPQRLKRVWNDFHGYRGQKAKSSRNKGLCGIHDYCQPWGEPQLGEGVVVSRQGREDSLDSRDASFDLNIKEPKT